LSDHLPHEDHALNPVEQDCPECGGKLKPLGGDVSRQLDIVDDTLKDIRIIRRKKACTSCDCIFQSQVPSRSTERSVGAPGLLARILVAKFTGHHPLYRMRSFVGV